MPSKRFVVDRCGSGAALDQSNWTNYVFNRSKADAILESYEVENYPPH